MEEQEDAVIAVITVIIIIQSIATVIRILVWERAVGWTGANPFVQVLTVIAQRQRVPVQVMATAAAHLWLIISQQVVIQLRAIVTAAAITIVIRMPQWFLRMFLVP